MPSSWQLQEAKQRFSEVVRQALEEGPQVVTRHAREAVVILSAKHYRRLLASGPDFKAFLEKGPDLGRLDIRRDKRPARRVKV
jgi:prevent-host-death family protein